MKQLTLQQALAEQKRRAALKAARNAGHGQRRIAVKRAQEATAEALRAGRAA